MCSGRIARHRVGAAGGEMNGIEPRAGNRPRASRPMTAAAEKCTQPLEILWRGRDREKRRMRVRGRNAKKSPSSERRAEASRGADARAVHRPTEGAYEQSARADDGRVT